MLNILNNKTKEIIQNLLTNKENFTFEFDQYIVSPHSSSYETAVNQVGLLYDQFTQILIQHRNSLKIQIKNHPEKEEKLKTDLNIIKESLTILNKSNNDYFQPL